MNRRIAVAAPFAALGILAIIAGGASAAAIAHHPTQPLVWMVAYLVLVVGVMQIAFGVGQAWLAEPVPRPATAWAQWLVFNLGNVGVIAGTLCKRPDAVAAATILFVLAIAWFFFGVHRGRHRGWCLAYRVLLGLLFASACIGLVISFVSHGAT